MILHWGYRLETTAKLIALGLLESAAPDHAPGLDHGQDGWNVGEGPERLEKKPNKLFFEAAGEPKQIWEVPNGQHIAGITTEPAEYERRVVGFFDEALLEKGKTP